MKAKDAVRDIMQRRDEGPSRLASKLGKTPRVITDRLSQDNISIEKLNEMLRVMDYKIVLVPVEERKKDGWYILD